jgi:DUF4097 and DUF4098 domain-containing protein YvlB
VIFSAGAATADTVKKMFFVAAKTFALSDGGAVIVQNPIGNIEIIGSDDAHDVTATAFKLVEAIDEAGLEEGRVGTALAVGGDARTRRFFTRLPKEASPRWKSFVTWRLTVPRSAHLRLLSNTGQHTRVTNVHGNVYVRNFDGAIMLDNLTGGVSVDSVNGSITYITPQPQSHVRLATVNGNVVAKVLPTADFRWFAETVKGDITTNLPARGTLIGASFRGSLNTPGGPTLTTATLTGNVSLLSSVTIRAAVQPLRNSPLVEKIAIGTSPFTPPAGPAPRGLNLEAVETAMFRHATNSGDVLVERIAGDADIFTGVGAVRLGSVGGSLHVVSHGGPLHFGQVAGPIQANTRAGDVFVNIARRGGKFTTSGGTIQVNHAGAATRLVNGGGDITVGRALGPIHADTTSGDIAITVDRSLKTLRITADTDRGNVVLNVSPGFGADVEATLVTADPDANTILSDIEGLSIQKEPFGTKTRVRATGKLNGGGEKVVLNAIDGGIRIVTSAPRR